MGSAASVLSDSARLVYALAISGDFRTLQTFLEAYQQRHGRQEDNSVHQAQVVSSGVLEHCGTTGLTPLLMACGRGHMVEVVELLLRHGANAHFIGPQPECTTALHEAVLIGNRQVVDLLLRFGADPFLENGRGLTALELAASEGSRALLRTLERKGKFAAQLEVRVPRLGHCSGWESRWVAVIPRHPCPADARPKAGPARIFLVAYESRDHCVPVFKVHLKGAQALLAQDGHLGTHCELALSPWEAPCWVHSTNGAPPSAQLHLRPSCLSGPRSQQALATFAQVVNDLDGRQALVAPPGVNTTPAVSTAVVSEPCSRAPRLASSPDDGVHDSHLAPTIPCFMSKTLPEVGADSEEGQCVVCLSEPASTGFTHGDSLHRCCCTDCAKFFKAKDDVCPICRQTIEAVILKFF